MLFLCEFVCSNECDLDHDDDNDHVIYTYMYIFLSGIVVRKVTEKSDAAKELVAIINHCEHKNYNKHSLQFGVELFV